MAAKAHLRNNRPLVIALSTNDGLGASLQNIATLYNKKNIYFVPFSQDDYSNKASSLVARFEFIGETLTKALNKEQRQPLII